MAFMHPVDLPVSSPFGERAGGFHPGIDFSGPDAAGHPIQAAADGMVIFKAFEEGGLGHTVTLQHDGVKSGYGHMRDPSPLNVGDPVHQGQLIGFVGTTGDSTGPHLHFWMGQNPNVGAVDPAPFLTGTQGDDDLNPDQAEKLDALYDALVGDGDGKSAAASMEWIRAYLGGVPGAFPDFVERVKSGAATPGDVDTKQIAAAIVAQLGDDLAKKVGDELSARLHN